MTRVEFRAVVDQLRLAIPFSETSGIRTVKRNFQVGGHEFSAHLVGLGQDLVLDDPADFPTLKQLASTLEVDAVLEPDCIHLEPKSYQVSLS
jgi:hypothetical protein